MAEAVRVEERGGVRVLRLSQPGRRNALTRPMLARLSELLPSAPASERQPVRAVVLAGDPAGGCFSAGFDLTAVDDAEREQGLDPIAAPAAALESCPVPVIAAIEGAAYGGALEVACACDLRVAGAGARLCMPPARLGLVYSASGLRRFLRLVTPGQARRLFLTGQPITAGEALTAGLIEHVAPTGDAVAVALAWAEAIAQNAPLAVAGLRDAIARLTRSPEPSADDRAAMARAREQTVHSADLAEGVRAFREKRPPDFRGC